MATQRYPQHSIHISFSHEIYLPEPLSVLCLSFQNPSAYSTATKVDLGYRSV